MTLPTFLGIGALKAGTTTLHHHLAAHPDVTLPRDRKEVMFFDRHWDKGVGWYAAQFDGSTPAVGEVSPGYLWHRDAPARCAEVLPDVALVAVLRAPVDRVVSQYRFFQKEQGFAGSLKAFVDAHPNAIERSQYAAQLDRWAVHHARHRILVLRFDDLVQAPHATMARVFDHIGVDPSRCGPLTTEAQNRSAPPRLPASTEPDAVRCAGRTTTIWAG